jgi:hypothetical protein
MLSLAWYWFSMFPPAWMVCLSLVSNRPEDAFLCSHKPEDAFLYGLISVSICLKRPYCFPRAWRCLFVFLPAKRFPFECSHLDALLSIPEMHNCLLMPCLKMPNCPEMPCQEMPNSPEMHIAHLPDNALSRDAYLSRDAHLSDDTMSRDA